MRYITGQMPRLRMIEETFVRWVHASNYEDRAAKDWKAFLTALEKNPVLYRAILGPITDHVLFKEDGLRKILARRRFEAPPDLDQTRVYRLNHSQPLMNFTILYYFRDQNHRFEKTDDIEVLFGFGIADENVDIKNTRVFASREPQLWREYQKLFRVLRNPKFSHRLNLDDPDLFRTEPDQCDVIATFEHIPGNEVVRKFKAARPGTHIRVCITGWRQLNSESANAYLVPLLERCDGEKQIHVDIVLWKIGSAFLNARQQTIAPGGFDVEHEVKGNRDLLERLSHYPNLKVRWTAAPMGPGAIFWIGDLIYFSPYWAGQSVARGPHFLVRANSPTGKALIEQFNLIWGQADENPSV
jgi:hypothetical protein